MILDNRLTDGGGDKSGEVNNMEAYIIEDKTSC
jgi:hypothetical protein